jgi:tRNA-specific 2-thiouridylase
MRALIAMSGGVDSSAAAHILLEKGYDVMGIILRLKPDNAADADIADAQRVANKLGIELRVVDRRDFFKKSVIDPFVAEYLSARTPNPCVECNYAIKFGAMLDYALENGCDGIATGHYAKIEECGGRFLLKRSESLKDQSYFLFRLNQFQLSHSVFPLEGMEKDFIRKKAEEAGIHVAEKKDSQEICFVPNDDYIAYLSSLGITSPKVSTSSVVSPVAIAGPISPQIFRQSIVAIDEHPKFTTLLQIKIAVKALSKCSMIYSTFFAFLSPFSTEC